MPRKKTQLNNLDEVDAIDQYAALKLEITDMVQAAGVNARLEITGDHSYDLEADGTLWLVHGGQRRATNTWRRIEWDVFREDVANNRLRQRIEAMGLARPIYGTTK